MAINPPLLALAVGAFGIGVTEFTPMGMLPLMAGDLGVSIPAAGLVVSAYALGARSGAPLMTLAAARVPRRRLLVGLMAIFTLGNLLAAIADSYAMLVVARLVTALNHGAFFGIGCGGGRRAGAAGAPGRRGGVDVLGADRGDDRRRAARRLGRRGARLAGGVLGHRHDRRGRHAGAAPGAAGAAGREPDDLRTELRALGRGPVLAALALTMVGFSAMFTLFTYIVPILRIETGATSLFVTAMLVLFGIGLTAGNWLGGRLADRSVDGTILGSLAAQIVVLALFAWGMQGEASAALLIVVWGIASFAIVPPLQMRVMDEAGAAPNLAAAMNIGAFNLGNAIGAAVGGGVIDAGLGYGAVPLAGAAMAALGLAFLLWLRRDGRVRAAAAARCG